MDGQVPFSLELHAKTSIVSQIILGGQDGLVNVLGIILGVATASGEIRIILAAGLAATFAESISMGAVAYTSKMAEKDYYFAELEREKKEIQDVPETEKAEIREIYRAKGFSGKLLDDITTHITSDKKIWLSTMMREELGMAPIKTKDIVNGSLIVGASAFIGSLICLSPFFFLNVSASVIASVVVSAITLFAIGVYKAKNSLGKPIRNGIEIAIIGMGAAVIGYGIGLLFKTY